VAGNQHRNRERTRAALAAQDGRQRSDASGRVGRAQGARLELSIGGRCESNSEPQGSPLRLFFCLKTAKNANSFAMQSYWASVCVEPPNEKFAGKLAGPRMGTLVHGLEIGRADVGIDLRGDEALVA